MVSVWLILADNTRQQCGWEMMRQSEADNIASELRQMGFDVVIEKWSV
jgi:hypothetical protein